MSIIRSRHTGIVCRDLKLMVQFYVGHLGFVLISQGAEIGEYLSTMLALQNVEALIVKCAAPDGYIIELLSFPSHMRQLHERDLCATGISHLAFTVEDLDKMHFNLSAVGVRFLSAPQLTAGGYRVCFMLDPEGNHIELVEVMQ